jgi:hypothetical protein
MLKIVRGKGPNPFLFFLPRINHQKKFSDFSGNPSKKNRSSVLC